jgi:hypothetical protein
VQVTCRGTRILLLERIMLLCVQVLLVHYYFFFFFFFYGKKRVYFQWSKYRKRCVLAMERIAAKYGRNLSLSRCCFSYGKNAQLDFLEKSCVSMLFFHVHGFGVYQLGRNQMCPFNPRLAALAKEKHVHGFFGFTCLHLVAAHFSYCVHAHFTARSCMNEDICCLNKERILLLHRVSILALFCVWTKSLICEDAVNRDSTFRVMSVDSACKSEEFQVPCQSFGRSSHPVWTPIYPLFHPCGRCVIPSERQTDKHHPSRQRALFVRTPTLYREASAPACFVRTFQQHVRTPISSRTVL